MNRVLFGGVELSRKAKVMSKISSEFKDDYLEIMLTDRMECMRGELLTLVDAITEDEKRREAIKSLVRKFTGDFWSEYSKDICAFLEDKGLKDKDSVEAR